MLDAAWIAEEPRIDEPHIGHWGRSRLAVRHWLGLGREIATVGDMLRERQDRPKGS